VEGGVERHTRDEVEKDGNPPATTLAVQPAFFILVYARHCILDVVSDVTRRGCEA
jgi:hypothetical protein